LLNLLKDFKFKYTLIIDVLLVFTEVITNKQENDAWMCTIIIINIIINIQINNNITLINN